MEPKQFDELTRTLANGISRRHALKIISVGLFGGVVSLLGNNQVFARTRAYLERRSLSLVAAASASCHPTNSVSIPCTQLNEYVSTCGVICPSGERLVTKGGCTEYEVYYPPDLTVQSLSEARIDKQWCATAVVSWIWVMTKPPVSTIINFSPSDPCCQEICNAEVAEVLSQLASHEEGHRQIINSAFSKVTADWASRSFTTCGKNKKDALANLNLTIQAAQSQSIQEFRTAANTHPPEARLINCSKCVSGEAGSICCWGECINPQDASDLTVCGDICCLPCQVCENGVCHDCSTLGRTCCNGVCCGNCETCVDGECKYVCDEANGYNCCQIGADPNNYQCHDGPCP